MNKIYKYAKKSVSKLDLSIKEKKELELQFIDHMNELYNNHKDNGFSEEDSLNYAINTFKANDYIYSDKKEEKKEVDKLVFLFFGIYCVIFILIYIFISRQERFRMRFDIRLLIPFKYLSYHIIQGFFYNSINSLNALKTQIPLFLAFIPIGFFIPIITCKYKSLLANFKKYLYITIGLQIIKIPIGFGRADIDYVLIHLLACLIGYFIFKEIKYIRNNREDISMSNLK